MADQVCATRAELCSHSILGSQWTPSCVRVLWVSFLVPRYVSFCEVYITAIKGATSPKGAWGWLLKALKQVIKGQISRAAPQQWLSQKVYWGDDSLSAICVHSGPECRAIRHQHSTKRGFTSGKDPCQGEDKAHAGLG